MLGRISGPKREEVTEGWRTVHAEKLQHFYSSPNIIGVNRSKRMRQAGHVARMEGMKNVYNIACHT
jgi:hypothetical protein